MSVLLFDLHMIRLTLPRVFSSVQRQLNTSCVRMQDTRPRGHRQNRVEFLKLLDYKLDVDEEKVEAMVHTSGLRYTDFDAKNGQPRPWQLMKFLESTRFFSHHWPLDDTGRTFRDYAEVTSDRMTFLVTSRMDFEKCIYDFKVPKCPLDVKIQGGYIGSTSLNSLASVYTSQGQQLFSNVNQVVSIDKSTRRPMILPEWWRNKYGEVAQKFSSLKFERYSRPDSLISYQVKVVRSDQDGNNHTNWSCYVRFSLDALYHNAKHGRMDNFKDVDLRGLQSMELLFSGESFDDDVLDVYVWNKEETSFTACAHIEKGNNVIFQGTFKYFDEPIF